jgi:uncharacterized protein
MAAYVLDTSAVVKRYILETGSGWVRSIADPAAANLIFLARITDVEVISAVVRRQRGGSLSAADAAATLTQFRQDLIRGYRIIEVMPALLLVFSVLARIATSSIVRIKRVQFLPFLRLTPSQSSLS